MNLNKHQLNELTELLSHIIKNEEILKGYYKHLGVNTLYDAIEYVQELYSKGNYELVTQYADTKEIDIITAYKNLYSTMTVSHLAYLIRYDYETFGNISIKEFNSRYKYYTPLELIETWEDLISIEHYSTIESAINAILYELSNETDNLRIIELSNGCYVIGN